MARTKSEKFVAEAFRELKKNPPTVVAQTRRKRGPKAARRQEIAIALNKARARGARI